MDILEILLVVPGTVTTSRLFPSALRCLAKPIFVDAKYVLDFSCAQAAQGLWQFSNTDALSSHIDSESLRTDTCTRMKEHDLGFELQFGTDSQRRIVHNQFAYPRNRLNLLAY